LQNCVDIDITNSSSATIEMLKGVVDKVAFFYCKRDEEDRRDQQKILLSLVKQLACPTSETGIHLAVTDAYTKEQQDPFSRDKLTRSQPYPFGYSDRKLSRPSHYSRCTR